MGKASKTLEAIAGVTAFAVGTALLAKFGVQNIADALEFLSYGSNYNALVSALPPLIYLSLMEEGEGLALHGSPRLLKKMYCGK